MAFNSVTSTYTGDALRAYILKLVVGGETLSTQSINTHTNVKYKKTLKRLFSSDLVQLYGCDWSETSGMTITEKVLQPEPLQIKESLCFDELWQLWDSEDMAAGMDNEQIPPELANAITDEATNKAGEANDVLVWQGNKTGATSTYLDAIDGLELQLDSGVPTGQTVAAVSAITKANVVTEMQRVLAAAPKALKKVPAANKVLFVSYDVAEKYNFNLQAQGVNTTSTDYEQAISNIEIRPVSGLSDDRYMMLTHRGNIHVATDLQSDFTSIKLIDLRNTTGDEKVRISMKYKFDIGIAEPAECVWYTD